MKTVKFVFFLTSIVMSIHCLTTPFNGKFDELVHNVRLCLKTTQKLITFREISWQNNLNKQLKEGRRQIFYTISKYDFQRYIFCL